MADIETKLAASPIKLAEQADFVIGRIHVQPAALAVKVDGIRREVQPRIMQVLVALWEAHPQVVSRERLIERCWNGVVVGDDALNRCILALRHLAEEFSPISFTIETVARVGYCLIERPADDTAATFRKIIRSPKVVIAGLLALAVTAIGAGYAWVWFGTTTPAPASIAVLPFRDLTDRTPYFAQGIGEEILGQLSREPEFRVAGNVSSGQFGKDPDIRQVAQKLDVNYVLEGSVRTQGNQVRVNAYLLRGSDGNRMWSESFDGNLDDVLAIQQRIGSGVAAALTRKLVHVQAGRARTINGEAYALYLNARGLVRSGNPEVGRDAVNLLRESIRLDPNFAPYWASLAQALRFQGGTMGTEGLIAILPEAQEAARHSLQLDPNLAEAHGVLGELLDADTPEGLAHVRRAAELDPRSGQGQIWQGAAHYISGKYAEGLASYRRAHDLDPLWSRPVQVLVDVNSGMGDYSAAEDIVRRGFPNDPTAQQFGLARVDWITGDFSEAVKKWSNIASNPSSRWASPAKLSLEDSLFMLNLSSNRPSRPVRPHLGEQLYGPRVWMSAAPTPSEWQNRNRSFAAQLVNHDFNIVAAKRMLLAGRASELVATYYGPTGVLLMRPGVRVGVCDLHEASLVALALRAAGRTEAADALLRESEALMVTAYRRGQVPMWFDEDAAEIWAVQGKVGLASDALKRALRRGAAHVGSTHLPKLKDEPAFRSLLGNPRFEAVRSLYEAHFVREREEIARALKIHVP